MDPSLILVLPLPLNLLILYFFTKNHGSWEDDFGQVSSEQFLKSGIIEMGGMTSGQLEQNPRYITRGHFVVV